MSWLELSGNGGLVAFLTASRLSNFVPGDEVNAVVQRELMRGLLRNERNITELRRNGSRIGLPTWSYVTPDHEIVDTVANAIDRGALCLKVLDESLPDDEVDEPNYRPKTMRAEHILAFQEAAKQYDVYILVREINLASLQHIGQGYAVPKRLDCKAKTADNDFHHATGLKASAGLVVDPNIAGPEAFGPIKYPKAQREWEGFARLMIKPEVATLQGQRSVTYIPGGGLYFVDLDPASARYGCLKFSASSLITAGKYVHGDFDLYGIVPASDPKRNVRVMEERLGAKHARSPEFFDVQHYINRRMGAPMVLHGAAEAYEEEHSDEAIDVFHPDGRITRAEGYGDLVELYQTEFKGRKLFTKHGQKDIVRGSYVTPA